MYYFEPFIENVLIPWVNTFIWSFRKRHARKGLSSQCERMFRNPGCNNM